MSRLDEVKEILNTLRVALTIAFGLLVFIVGSMLNKHENNEIDFVFWAGAFFFFLILGAIVFIARKLSSKTKEIRRL